MRNVAYLGAIAAAFLVTGAASAQSAAPVNGTIFKGFRAEAQVGGDRFQSQGTHDDSLGYGAEAGWDGEIDGIIVGPYGSYWRGKGENITTGTGGLGVVTHKTFQEIGAGVRVGYQLSPAFLVYGQGGYVNNEQRKAYSGNNAARRGAYYDNFKTDGYQVGGGIEYSVMQNLYVKAGYKYSNYSDHTAKHALYSGIGVRF